MSFLPDIVKKGWTEEEVFGICFESERERNRRRLQAIVCDHHLKQVKEFLLYNELAIWRRENGFDQVMEGEESCFPGHYSLPPTPQEYYASLWCEVNALKDAISIPAKSRPRQKDSMDELLAKFDYAEIKRCIDKQCREEAQAKAQMTAKPVGTVQQYGPSSPNPDRPSGVLCNLENEGTMSQELEELTSSSTGTGLNTPGQQCPPNEGVWETGRIIADGILTAGVDSSKEGNISSPMESTERATRMITVADIPSTAATPPKRRHKTSSEENNFRPGWKRRAGPALESGCTSTFFFLWRSWEASCLSAWGEAARLFSVSSMLCFFSVFPNY